MIAPGIAAVVVGAFGIGLLVDAASKLSDQGSDSGTVAAAGVVLLVVAAVIVAVAFWRRSKTEMA